MFYHGVFIRSSHQHQPLQKSFTSTPTRMNIFKSTPMQTRSCVFIKVDTRSVDFRKQTLYFCRPHKAFPTVDMFFLLFFFKEDSETAFVWAGISRRISKHSGDHVRDEIPFWMRWSFIKIFMSFDQVALHQEQEATAEQATTRCYRQPRNCVLSNVNEIFLPHFFFLRLQNHHEISQIHSWHNGFIRQLPY